MVINTNVKKLKHSKSKTKQIFEGESPSQATFHPYRTSYLSSSSKIVSQWRITTAGKSNEGCLGGGDGEYPNHGKTRNSHAIDHPQKRRKSQRFPKDSEIEIFKGLEDMEVDMSGKIPDWDICDYFKVER